MKTLKIIESIKNFWDVGVIIESLNNARKRRFEMDVVEFLKQLFWGKGYYNITPPQLSEKMEKRGNDLLVIDLREKEQFEKYHRLAQVLYRLEFETWIGGLIADK